MRAGCLVFNRWTDDFAHYDRIIDHTACDVAYITVEGHAARLPDGAARHVETVERPDDRDAVIAAARRCHAALGRIDKLIALSEFDLLLAAELRDLLGVPGYGLSEVRRFRDKIAMKRAIQAAGLRVPRFAALDDDAAVGSLVEAAGFPLIVKPRGGAASEGCELAHTPEALARLREERRGQGQECEEFVHGPIYHVDGLACGGALRFVRAWRYLNTCYDFAKGRPLGSVMLDPARARPLIAFARRSLRALGLDHGAFHLEIIEGREGLYFMEIGARVGGGEIPFVVRDLYGVDLVGDWLRLELGQPPQTVGTARADSLELGGFLMIPEAVGRRLVRCRSPLGSVPGLYDHDLPPPGHVFDGHGGYDTLLGRFRFRGATPAAIEQAIWQALDLYDYELEAPAADTADGSLADAVTC